MFEKATDRYFCNRAHESKSINARDELLQSLDRINTHNPPVQTCSTGWTFNGLYTGPTSIAYLFYRLHSIYPDLEFKSQSLLDWAHAYLDLSAHVRTADPDPDHCGIANETIAQCTLRAVILRDTSLASRVCSYSTVVNVKTQPGSNEWLYGRAGYLYFLRLIQSEFPPAVSSSVSKHVTLAIHRTIERIIETPHLWTWNGKEYLGAAHGVVGIITQIVLSDPSSAPKLQDLLERILTQQFPSGNLPSSPSVPSDKLVQFCHGSPGLVLSLSSLKPYFPSLGSKIDECMTQARKDVWKRGLSTKEPSLCHGIAGNVLALDTDSAFQHFLSHMTSESPETQEWIHNAGRSDKFVSLYTGEAGRAWTWAIADQNLPKLCIGYNDL